MAMEQRSLDPNIWKACAGISVQIPAVGSRVYYFPQGHAEQASSPVDFSSVACKKPYVICRITAVTFLANPDTDEVFAKIDLDPRLLPPYLEGSGRPSPEYSSLEDPDDNGVVSFAKILTPSDANNGGGFSVPRYCADSIFPVLNYEADPPVQTLSIRDVHGTSWEFRHIYRGTPRRHLLTTGWSKFVNHKKLVAGDSIIFIRNQKHELFVGVRRAARSCGPVDYSQYASRTDPAAGAVKLEENPGSGAGFSRNVRGRVPVESVVEAIRSAEMGHPFVVIYYPKTGSDFVVAADVVETASRVNWTAGMQVKLSVETEDSSRTTWFQGVVTGITVQDLPLWFGSPWRMLQVTWDEPEVLPNLKSVNPWLVELVSASPQAQIPYPSTKKLRVPHIPDFSINGEGNMFLPESGFSSTTMGSLTPTMFSYNSFPAGMQGARHDAICVSNIPDFVPTDTHHMYSDNPYGNNMPHKLAEVSTELSIWSTSPSESSSPQSHGSIGYYGTELPSAAACNPTRKTSGVYLQLFGEKIQVEEPQSESSSPQSRGSIGYYGTELPGAVATNPTRKTSGVSLQLFDKKIQAEEPLETEGAVPYFDFFSPQPR